MQKCIVENKLTCKKYRESGSAIYVLFGWHSQRIVFTLGVKFAAIYLSPQSNNTDYYAQLFGGTRALIMTCALERELQKKPNCPCSRNPAQAVISVLL